MGADVMVVRHPTPGAPHLLARHVESSIINAGDGAHEHPTQGLLDLMTIRQQEGDDRGADGCTRRRYQPLTRRSVKHLGSDEARRESNPLRPANARPKASRSAWLRGCLSPRRRLAPSATSSMCLRIQFERAAGGSFPSIAEYSHFYGMNQAESRPRKAGPVAARPRADQSRSRTDARGRRRPEFGDPRPGDQRAGRPDGRPLSRLRPQRHPSPRDGSDASWTRSASPAAG